MCLESARVVDDVAASGKETGRCSVPAGVLVEGVVGVSDDGAGWAEAETAERVIAEPLSRKSLAVPEADHTRVVEDMAVPGPARVASEHW